MKTTTVRIRKILAAIVSAAALIGQTQAADFVKADNTTQLNLAGSWTNGAVPGTSDTIVYDSTLTAGRTNFIGGSLSVLGFNFATTQAAQINQTGTATLTLGSGGLVKSGAGTLIYNNAIALGASQTWNIQATRVQLAGGSTLDYGGNNLTVTGAGGLDIRSTNPISFENASLSLSNVFVNNSTATFGANNTFNSLQLASGRAIGSSIGNLGVASSFGTNTITLGFTAGSGIIEYIGNSVSVNRSISRDARSPGSGITVTTAGQTLTISGAFSSGSNINATTNGWAFGGAGNLTLNGVINNATGAGSTGTTVTKSGTGTLTLGATHTYTGATTVNEGSLIVNGTINSNSVLSVVSGAVLGGSGTIGGATTVSGSLRPGNSIGTLTVNADTTWNAGDDWVFELGSPAPTIGEIVPGNSDLLAIAGVGSDFLKGTGSAWTFDFADTGTEGFYQLVTWSGTTDFSASDFTASKLGSGLSGEFTIQDNALYLEVVPEPSTYALLGFAAAGLGAHLLRRRKR